MLKGNGKKHEKNLEKKERRGKGLNRKEIKKTDTKSFIKNRKLHSLSDVVCTLCSYVCRVRETISLIINIPSLNVLPFLCTTHRFVLP